MTPAPGAGGEAKRKKRRRRRRPANPSSPTQNSSAPNSPHGESSSDGARAYQKNNRLKKRTMYAKRVDEVSAGGLVIDSSGTRGLLIGRRDIKDPTGTKFLWSLPKGHIEEGETPEQAAIREVKEETGIDSSISRSLGVIDFWFMAGGKRIHKTVHHFLFTEVGGDIAPQESEVDAVDWFPLNEIVSQLAYSDEKKLIAKSELKI